MTGRFSAGQQRKAQRVVHLIGGVALFGYVYWPLGADFQDIVRFAVFPALTATGVAMWQAPRLRRLLGRSRKRGVRPAPGTLS